MSEPALHPAIILALTPRDQFRGRPRFLSSPQLVILAEFLKLPVNHLPPHKIRRGNLRTLRGFLTNSPLELLFGVYGPASSLDYVQRGCISNNQMKVPNLTKHGLRLLSRATALVTG